MMTILSISGIVILLVWVAWLNDSYNNLKKECLDLKRKINSNDHDINTLHFNQKVLQSSVKELHRDLKIYGEIKRSRVRGLVNETKEKEEI